MKLSKLMQPRNQSDPRRNFVPRLLPWILAAAGLGLYALTLHPGVSMFNYLAVAKLSGWTWQPEVLNPLFFIVTAPLRWLPQALIPVALNLFSALCAALTLGLLARSVAILPHDRTDAQRVRESSAFSFLTLGTAWLPPVFAVLVGGLQMTFWEQATNSTPEMFELLLFAFVIWSLLEYRLDERLGRLYLAAAVYGAGLTENWAMTGFLPVFVGAVLWIRGLSFFNARFLRGMMLSALAGMTLYLVLPVMAAASHTSDVSFWQALKSNLSSQWLIVKIFFTNPEVRRTVLLLAPGSLLPALLLAVRWGSSFGDNSKIGMALTSILFHTIHAILLALCVWIAFDPSYSPRHLGLGLPFLTFYYLGALSVGYFTGYFLLLFGKPAQRDSRREKSRSEQMREESLRSLNRLVIAGIWLFAVLAATGLLYKNIPQIRATNDDTFRRYFALAAESLPPAGAVVLSDDSRRLIFLQSALTQSGRAKDFVLVDSQFLPAPPYHAYLHQKHPKQWPDTISASEKTNGIPLLHLISLLATLAQTNDLYYLHPSFGYYFEQFYAEPHGLVYKLKTLPNDTLLPPLPDKNRIAANEDFWAQAEKTTFPPILKIITAEDEAGQTGRGERLLQKFHVPREPNPNAAIAGAYYSRNLNFWGVQCQRAGELTRAAAHFDLAQKLNPDNTFAQINLQFNQALQSGQGASENLAASLTDPFGKYRTLQAALSVNGPLDVPSFCFEIGVALVEQNGFFRQAVDPLERVRQLVPDNLAARLWLAQIYLASRLPDRALDALGDPLAQPKRFLLNPTNSIQLNICAAAAYFQKTNLLRGTALLETEIARHPDNNDLLIAAAQAYASRGLFTNALAVIDRKLRLTPDDPTWLFGKGYASIQAGAYDEAITALTRLLALQTNNTDALFNRAIARLKSDQLDAARADYQALQNTFTNSFQIAYGLGEIAWRKHETNEAVKHYRLYLTTADTNTAEARGILQRLQEISKPAH